MITDRLHQTILSSTNVAGSENHGSSGFNEADVLEFYSSLMDLQKKHGQCNSKFPLDIPFDGLFLPYVNSWLDSADCKTKLIEPKKAEEIYAKYFLEQKNKSAHKLLDDLHETAKLLKPVDNAEELKSINKVIMTTYARMKRLAEKGLIESQDERNTGEITMTEGGASEFDNMERKPEKIGIETKKTAKTKFPKYRYGGKYQLTKGDQRFFGFNEMKKMKFDRFLKPPFTGLGPKTFNQLEIQSKELTRHMPLIYEKLESLEEKRNIIKSKLNDMGDLGQYFLEAMEQVTKDVPLVHCDDIQLFVIHKNKT
ncbi:hypothetical protein BY996DRAFT_6414260 [Phakopsora pachyrhizi]|nr:hypothetical protein BY996DRAFT_6414260 [Phakopsora pachyrhizi]